MKRWIAAITGVLIATGVAIEGMMWWKKKHPPETEEETTA
jgi:hypothetical protein